ncbi:helix-turn-helix transcriptional regulator [Escherichia coli]|uniref:helix-turn-helix transcriptional regulator n=1 Tax=Escherichia coli TaxID=562 RepID=UPI000BE7D0EB|nr:helix-turn-helix transcriptional regulator [Escherichia coli]EFB3463700.1 helix-turn-helix transcriptional regulator [Escherichia coli]HAP3355978.1 helix-turn-helix transcriptional regulator [Escherichia coli]HBA8260923.1 helix-turn-helix transcriptional regulator [Escherichia coli]HDK0815481.1 helix-turn-helix transcriptional regulator [Escherichia coli]
MKRRNFIITEKLKKHILLSLTDNPILSIKDVSLISGFSVKHTQELFFKQNKITIGKYIKKVLLSRAALLLVLTKKRILDIAFETGFSSQQSFNRAFKKNFSLPPMQYRKRGVIDCNKIITSAHSENNFVYEGEIYLTPIKIRALHLRFRENVLGCGSTKVKNERLRNITKALSKDNLVMIISSIKVTESKMNDIYIDSCFCYPSSLGKEIKTPSGLYHKIKFIGSFDNYINTGRYILSYINIPFALEVIEEFIKKQENDIEINIYLPNIHFKKKNIINKNKLKSA